MREAFGFGVGWFCPASLLCQPKLVQQPQAGVVGLRVLGELPAPVSIEDQHTSARLAAQVVRVVRRVGIIQETQRVRQERPGERVAACAVRLDGVRGQHGGAMLLRDVWGCNAVRRGCRRVRGSGEKTGREEGDGWGAIPPRRNGEPHHGVG